MQKKNQVFYTLKQKNKFKHNDMIEKGNHGLNCEKYRQAPEHHHPTRQRDGQPFGKNS
jgi:hypothetical protein